MDVPFGKLGTGGDVVGEHLQPRGTNMKSAKWMSKSEYMVSEKRVKAVLEELGATCHDGQAYKLQTPVGEMTVTLHKWMPRSLFWVFQRFTDATKAAEVVDCNPCSGKWNFQSVSLWERQLRDFLTTTTIN